MAVDGKWNLTINTPMGTQTPTLTLKNEGGKLSGSLDGAQGRADIKEGSAEGDNATFKLDINGPAGQIELTFKGAVDGDAIQGDVELGAFGSAKFTGKRA